MRRFSSLLIVSIVLVNARLAVAQEVTAHFKVSGNLGVAAANDCNSVTYPKFCPSADDCACFALSRHSKHFAQPIEGIKIPPGTEKAYFAVDEKDGTGSGPGTCDPLYGEVDYKADSGPDAVTIFLFGSVCGSFAAGESPLSVPFQIPGGGAVESAVIESPFGLLAPAGYGIGTGVYTPGATQNFSLSLTAVVLPFGE
jgi:hypothetical protein